MQHIASLIQSALDSNGPGNEIGRLPRAIPRPRTRTLTDLFPRCWAPFEGTEAERFANFASMSTVELYVCALLARQNAEAARAFKAACPRSAFAASFCGSREREERIAIAAYEAEWMIHTTGPVVERISL